MSVIDEVRLDDPAFLLPTPHAEFAALRTHAPVCYDHRTDAWVVSRYGDVAFALKHPEIFISASGTSPEDRVAPGQKPAHGGDFMLASDAPRHTELRAAVQPGYTQPRVASWEDRLRVMISELVDGLAVGESIDAHRLIAKRVAIGSVCDYLGVPSDDVAWVDAASSVWRPENSPWSGESALDYPENSLERYFALLLADRADHPTADVLSMVAGERGQSLSLRAKLMLCIDLVVAGNEPTAAALSGGLHTLTEHPDAYASIRREPALLPTAVNELLRWVSPVPYMCRTTTTDVGLGGQTIPAGSFVYLLYASANHDEQMWTNPEVLDVRRTDASKHMSFGRGAHTCIGGGVVRQVFRVLLEEMTARFSEIGPGGPVGLVPGIHMPHLGHLPILLTSPDRLPRKA